MSEQEHDGPGTEVYATERMGGARVVCDHCDFSQDVDPNDGVREWHRKPCPSCGAPNIINDEDLLLWESWQGLLEIFGDVALEEPKDTPMVRLEANSRGGDLNVSVTLPDLEHAGTPPRSGDAEAE